MNKIKLIVIIVAVMISNYGSAQKNVNNSNVQFYKFLDVTNYELSFSLSNNELNYNGKVKSITYDKNNYIQILPSGYIKKLKTGDDYNGSNTQEWAYDTQNRIISRTSVSTGKYKSESKTTFVFSDSSCVKYRKTKGKKMDTTFYNLRTNKKIDYGYLFLRNNCIYANGYHYKYNFVKPYNQLEEIKTDYGKRETRKYNADGKLSEILYYENEKQKKEYKFTYKDKLLFVSVKTIYTNAKFDTRFYTVKFEYDSENNWISAQVGRRGAGTLGKITRTIEYY